MACISPQGELSESARNILTALATPLTSEEVASRTSLPLFRVRAGLREMAESELVTLTNSRYTPTERGRSLLA